MARPSQSPEKIKELLPVVARAFAELGYRRTTTADLARRCGVRENVLYRLEHNIVIGIEYDESGRAIQSGSQSPLDNPHVG